MTVAGNISGTGTVYQVGTGGSALTGSNNFSGPFVVSAGSISTNDTSNTVSAINSASTHPGYMDTVGDGSGTRLGNKFNISPDSNPTHLVTADNPINYVVGAPSSTLPLYVSQQVVTETAGTYKITITYTCSGIY